MSAARDAAKCAVALIEGGFTDYACAVLEDCRDAAVRPALAIVQRGDTAKALPLLRELAA